VSVVSDVEKLQGRVSTAQYDVVVVGAGPYGLSAAAHLQGRDLKVAIFGKPMKLWREHMPKGMFLRSHWWASNLSDPNKKYGFAQFFKVSQYKPCYPVPIEAFIDYGMWFQKHVLPNVDETYVASIERNGKQFLLTLADGRKVQSLAVVMAIGLYYYANRPDEYDHMPAELVTHSFEYSDFDRFAGKQVVMIGGGQSAVEYAALLHEAGAHVHLVPRRPIHWLAPDTDGKRSFIEQVRAPRAGIAPGWKNWALEYFPYLFQRFSQDKKDRYIRNHYNAAASDWLKERIIGKVTLHEGQKVEKVSAVNDTVELTLSNHEVLKANHLILATGYRVDIHRLAMLHPSLLADIQTDTDIPILSNRFESSVPGLYFVGLTSLRNFGPLFRFVVGTKAAAERVAGAVAKQVTHAK
jgi:FAD-dependent urate hydroxylase